MQEENGSSHGRVVEASRQIRALEDQASLVETVHGLFQNFDHKCQLLLHQWERGGDIIAQQHAQTNQQLERIRRAIFTPGTVSRQGPSFQQLVHVLRASPDTAAQDLQWILQEGMSLPTKGQAQANFLKETPQFHAWLASAEPCCLFAQADTADDGLISALSLVSGLVSETMRSHSEVLSLHYACGLHTDRYRDAHPDAQGVLQHLIVQLLSTPQYRMFSLAFVDEAMFEGLRNAGMDALCAVFEGLLYQLPHRAIVVLVVDGVSFYGTEDKVKGMCDAMSMLIHLVGETNCLVKLLVTNSGMSDYVRTGFHEEEVVWIAD
ncbi:MAG: hypothetical protein L6R36_007843 [Xanthoria steineri]|nr:MAG: hypothetical protein L6R36_007843 [Xanthoria steineri]